MEKTRSLLDRVPFKLAHVQVVIKTLLFQQAVMCAAFDDLAAVDDQYLVSIADRRKAMSNDETGATFH
jgi:hypothetical protein